MADIVPGQPELIRYGGFAVATDFPNLFTGKNGDFTAWSGGIPTDWADNSTNGVISEVAPGNLSGEGGNGACNFKSVFPAAAGCALFSDTAITGAVEDHSLDMDVWTDGVGPDNLLVTSANPNVAIPNVDFHWSRVYVPDNTNSDFRFSAPTSNEYDITIDNMFLRVMTPWVFVRDWNLTSNISAIWTSSETDTERSILQTFGSNADEVYQVIFNISSLTLDDTPTTVLEVSVNGGGVNNIYSGGTYTLYLVAGGTTSAGLKFQVKNDTAADTLTIKAVSVKHVPSKESTDSETLILTGTESVGDTFTDIGPNGVYRRTTTLNDGKPTWASEEEHPDGGGGTATWYIWWDVDSGSWILGQNVDTVGANDWALVSTIQIPIGAVLTPNGNGAGDATLYGGPVSGSRRDTRARSRYNG